MEMIDVVLQSAKDGTAQVSLINQLGIAQKMEGGVDVDSTHPVEVLTQEEKNSLKTDENPLDGFRDCLALVNAIDTKCDVLGEANRKRVLREYLDSRATSMGTTTKECQQVLSFLEQYHDIFSLTESEREETDLVEMTIETGDATPKKQAARRLPFAVRKEVARQLENMQEQKLFGLMNAPAVFQRLMQQVISNLNPVEGPNFVSVYIDNLLVYSRTLEEHLDHLSKVMERLREMNLKLKPSKFHFVRQSVEFLGHILMPKGLQPNPKVAAVQKIPVSQNVSKVCQFLGLNFSNSLD